MPHLMGNDLSQLGPPPVHKGLTAEEVKRLDILHPDGGSNHSMGSPIAMDEEIQHASAGVEHANRKRDDPTATTINRIISRPSKSHNTLLHPTVLKSVNHFARRHKFLTEQSFERYATSQRRAFERDVYDYARSISLSKAQAKASIIHARSLCGEENYDSDDSRLDDDEVDDSSARLASLGASTGTSLQVQQAPPPTNPEEPSGSSAIEIRNSMKRPNDAPDNPGEKKRKANNETAMRGMKSSQAPRESQNYASATADAAPPTEADARLYEEPPLHGLDNEARKELPKELPKELGKQSLQTAARSGPQSSYARNENRAVPGNRQKSVTGSGANDARGSRAPTESPEIPDSLTRPNESQPMHQTRTDSTGLNGSGLTGHGKVGGVESRASKAVGRQNATSSAEVGDHPAALRHKLWRSFKYGALDWYGNGAASDLKPELSKSFEIAQDLVDREARERQPKLANRLARAFKHGAREYCASYHKRRRENGDLLRKTLKAHIDTTLVEWREKIGKTQLCTRETRGSFEQYSNISNPWQSTGYDECLRVQAQADVTMHDQSEPSDSNSDSGPDLDSISNNGSDRDSNSDSGSNSISVAENEHSVEVADSAKEVKAESDQDERPKEVDRRGKIGKALACEQPGGSDSTEGSGASEEDEVEVQRNEPIEEEESDDNIKSEDVEESENREDSEDPEESEDSENDEQSETDNRPEKLSGVHSSQAGASAARASTRSLPGNPLQCCICQKVYETREKLYRHSKSSHRNPVSCRGALECQGPANASKARRREWREAAEASSVEEKRGEEFERTTHSFGGFSESDDSESMMATDEDTLDKAIVVQGLGLRGGAAAKVVNGDSNSDVGSSRNGSQDEGPSESTSGVSDVSGNRSEEVQEYRGLDPSRIMAMVDIVRKIEKALSGNASNASQRSPPVLQSSTPIKIRVSCASSSSLSSAPSSPVWPTPDGKEEAGDHKLGKKQREQLTPSTKRTPSSKTSPYFVPSPKVAKEAVSCIPFPPLSSTSFGLVQESLASKPFHLLIAVIFLNKTRGAVAMPVFYNFITRFPDPASLAAADLGEVVGFFQNLGLQNQRARKCIALAKAWLQHWPAKGKRWRRLHYPNLGDGKDIKGNEEPIADETEDGRVGWEVGHMPGIGAYGIDSWRIFCRDELRGFGTAELPHIPPDATEETRAKVEEEEMRREWTRVLPLDKELRAYLRWRWLRLSWEWDPKTGERRRAEAGVIKEAKNGGVIYEGDQGWSMGKEGKKEEIRQMGGLS
ncbi:MAG: hypothetical protein Q9173_004769 [Seirophora scorigena]